MSPMGVQITQAYIECFQRVTCSVLLLWEALRTLMAVLDFEGPIVLIIMTLIVTFFFFDLICLRIFLQMHLCGVFMSYSKTWIVCAAVSSCFVQETSFATMYKWQTKIFVSWDLKQSLAWKVPFPFSILSFSLALVNCRNPKCLGLYFLKSVALGWSSTVPVPLTKDSTLFYPYYSYGLPCINRSDLESQKWLFFFCSHSMFLFYTAQY